MESCATFDNWQRLAEVKVFFRDTHASHFYLTRSRLNDLHLLTKDVASHLTMEGKKDLFRNFERADRTVRHYDVEKDLSWRRGKESVEKTGNLLRSLGFTFNDKLSSDLDSLQDVEVKLNNYPDMKLNLSFEHKIHRADDSIERKFWNQRYRIFSKFDEGIQVDQTDLSSVLPETIASHIASRCKGKTVVDAFCGVGQFTIQLAMVCDRVISLESSPRKLRMARLNARIYGVEDKITFINANFMEYCFPWGVEVDAVYLGPNWGDYSTEGIYSLKSIQPDFPSMIMKARQLSDNIAVVLPRNVAIDELTELDNGKFEIEQNLVIGKVKNVTVYYGQLVDETRSPILNNESLSSNKHTDNGYYGKNGSFIYIPPTESYKNFYSREKKNHFQSQRKTSRIF